MLFNEGNITSALARVCNSDGATLGTAFFILPSEGIALTCHHLISTQDESILLDCGDGELRRGRVAIDDRFPAIDLAVISEVEAPRVTALPIVGDYQGISRFWSKGFHYYGTQIVDALPTSGEVEGETSTRFSTQGRDYELKKVLLLRTAVIDAGLSGAPVIDPETGVAFAIVNAKFGKSSPIGGLALPFARAQEHSAKLRELFEANASAVPRFGRFLNRLGALKICQVQRDSVIDRLIKRGFFLPDKYCARNEQDAVSKFYGSDLLILPIVGNAGVGKTTLLANIARQPEARAALLMLARDLRPDETELSVAIDSKLREHVSDLLGPRGDISFVISSLQSAGEQLTVILDGLNEIPVAAAQSLDSWLDRSITWLEETNTKLIVSSRSEYWQTCVSLFPEERMYQESNKKDSQVGLSLGDFSEDEAERVKDLYSLAPAIPIHHIQHPLIARIYLELESEVTQARVVGTTRYQVLQRFIKLKCDRIARAVGLGVLSSHVESCLIEAARVTLATGQLEFEDSQFFSLFMNNAALADQFVHEGLFMTTSGGKRFGFDEIAEFLQSKLLGIDTIVTYFSPNKNVQKLTTGAIVYAILRLDEQGKSELVSRAISAIVRGHRLFANEEEYWPRYGICESVLPQLVQQIQSPEQFRVDIEAYAADLAGNESYLDFIYDRFGFRLAVGRSRLPLTLKLSLLRTFLLREDSYDFEHHHWDDLERYVIRSRGHTGTILAELIQATPLAVFECLIEWLTDSTLLREHKSTVADAAIAMMFFYRHLAFESLCELVARSATAKGGILLTYISNNDPLKTLDVCLKWLNRDDPLLLKYSAVLATTIAGSVSDTTLDDKIYEVLTGVMGRLSNEIDTIATKGIGRLKKYREAVVAELISHFERGDPVVDGYAIAELSDTHFDSIVVAIRKLIKFRAERASEAVSALMHQSRSPEQLDAMMDLIDFGAEEGLLRFHTFRMAIEYLLYQSRGARLPGRVMDLVQHAIRIEPEVRLHLGYFACASHREDINERNIQDQLLELLIATGTDDEREWMLRQLIGTGRYSPDDLKTFLTIQETMPVEQFHRVLIRAAYMHEGFVTRLVDWLQLEGGISPFGPTQTLLDRVRNGETGTEVIRNIFDDSY
jgi:NACHT domain